MSALNYFNNKPKIQAIDVKAYLDRIGLQEEKTSLQFLKKLHRHHLLNIPFENLDIHYKKPIILDFQKIFNKIVVQKRGGICYELNGLFLHLLANLGFDVFAGSAQVIREGKLSTEFDHMVIFVHLEGQIYLIDVGFGEGFCYPKLIEEKHSQLDYTVYYRLIKNPDEYWVLQKSGDNSLFEDVYLFLLQPRELIEFLARCNYHQESMDSPFMQQKLITQLFREGRMTLTDRYLNSQLLGETKSQSILNEDEFFSHLEQIFGISTTDLIQQQFD